jgi:ferredoxin
LRIQVDKARCTGHAMCAARAPEVYELDDLGHCSVDGREVPPSLEEAARLGAQACPERAIQVVEASRD